MAELALQTEYNEDGKIKAEYFMLAGILHDKYTNFYEENNQPQSILIFNHGRLDGVCSFFNDEGKLSQLVRFRNDKINGRMLIFQNDKISTCADYINDQLHGSMIGFYESGRLKFRMRYEQGKLNGAAYYFDEAGSLLSEAHYSSGKLHGNSIIYNIKGMLAKIDKYYYGQLIK
jgi:antitoxin component YwqK of YwqJK toxin-antitoxin module